MRVKAVLEYHGAAYAGWQAQPNRPTIQVALQAAIEIVTGAAVRVDGAGRTDAGVHAAGQVAAFDVPDGTDLYRLRGALNGLTARDLSVVSLEPVAEGFDPRRQARARTYGYTVVAGRPRVPLLDDRCWHVYPHLDFDVLSGLAASLVGTRDFRAFRAADCDSPSTVRNVVASRWSRGGAWGVRDDRIYTYEITANAFLKHLVRTLVGSMVDVALGRLDEALFLRLLEGPGERKQAGRTAPACGLVLLRVDY